MAICTTDMVSQQRGRSHRNSMAHRVGTFETYRLFLLNPVILVAIHMLELELEPWKTVMSNLKFLLAHCYEVLGVCQHSLHCNIVILLALLQVKPDMPVEE